MTTLRKCGMAPFVGLVALAAVVLPVGAQETVDDRWLPFVGCWEPVNGEADAGLLCFNLANGGVSMVNMAAGASVSVEQLVADGQMRTVSAEGCEGSESVEFSSNGRRAFTRSEFVCGAGTPRTGTGVMAFTSQTQWIDVRALDVDGETVTWVQHYRLVGMDRLLEEGVSDPSEGLGMAVRTARMVAARAIDLGDVEEAVKRIDEKAVETWVAAQGGGFDLDADDLERLADNGVPEGVIDVVVAVSYPHSFVVEATGSIETAGARTAYRGYRGYMAYNPFFGPGAYASYGYSPFGYFGSAYSYGYGYGYGYGSGYYGGYGGYGPVVVVVTPRSSGGRVYNGRGYSSGGSASGGTARPRSGSSQPSYSTGGSRVGSSGGSSSGSTGRTAKRRRGGS
jgi:hypothetical protein